MINLKWKKNLKLEPIYFFSISVKDLQTLGAAETKLLYTLHWILLFAAEECADEDVDNMKRRNEKHAPYLFSIPTISVKKFFRRK